MVHFELGNDFFLKLRSIGFRKNSKSHEEVIHHCISETLYSELKKIPSCAHATCPAYNIAVAQLTIRRLCCSVA